MSDRTRQQVDTFWELVDEIFNAVLFVLMGFELIRLPFRSRAFRLGILAIPVVLVARAVSVGIFAMALRRASLSERGSWRILTWGGLRGGISFALALSLPPSLERDRLVTMTYVVVVFSVLVQGLTVGRLVKRIQDEQGRGIRGAGTRS
jgi:CPA1 family monovalent cation:H+ antiporter